MLRFSSLLVVLSLLWCVQAHAGGRHNRLNDLKPKHSKLSTVERVAGTLQIDASKPLVNVSKDLYGVFFEEINHAGHGGLYSQAIANSNFEDWRSIVDPWVENGNVTLSIDKRVPLNGYNPNSLKISSSASLKSGTTVGVTNPGFWGVNANVSVYHMSFWARSTSIKTINVALTNADGTTEYSKGSVQGVTARWQKFTVDLKLTPAADNTAAFQFQWQTTGVMDTVFLDVVTAFPDDGWMGLPYVRSDLANRIAAIHPAFVRFPGGCYVEGDDLVNRFNWKNALGPVEERAGHWDLWNYWSEDGLGLFEYLSIIEKLTDSYGAPTRAIWVVNNGISHAQSLTPQQVKPYLQDALDSIEFAMGDIDTEWGRLRADMGHEDPFSIAYMAIGNEDCGKPYYPENYQLFYDAISSRYPNIQLISNCEPNSIKGHPVQVWDYHIYTDPVSLAHGSTTFDSPQWRAGNSKIFNSEYAVTTGAGKGNLIAALAEAAWMTGLERNSDVVTTASYAPLFVNEADRFWNPDAIVFNSESSYGTPSYWNQVAWSNSFSGVVGGSVQTLSYKLSSGLLNVSVAVSIGEASSQHSKSKAGADIVVIHKLVNIKADSQDLSITLGGLGSAKLNPTLDIVTLTGSGPEVENTMDNPETIVPVSSTMTISGAQFDVTLPPWSLVIVRAHVSSS